ncbi:MAG: L-serine ammonia-lyase, iron-sulfur-dependent, subunit alpha [Clostridia bacterium]
MELFKEMIDVLNEELVPALGCTEPIAIAYASAVARKALDDFPDKVEIAVSGNIIKNVKGVVVPNTNGMKGIEAACVVGIVGGDVEAKLEVLEKINDEHLKVVQKLLATNFCAVTHLYSDAPLHIIVKAFKGEKTAEVELKNGHTNIAKVEINGVVAYKKETDKVSEKSFNFKLRDIYDFAKNGNIDEVKGVLQRQVDLNMAICVEGMKNNYGQSIGKTLVEIYGNDVKVRARAYAAAGSDARMNGCSLPVVINSGSGNQGITVSVPVALWGEELKVDKELMLRSLALSNLVSIYLKKGIGKLSAVCGVVSASCGAGAGIAFISGGDFERVSRTITNTVANVSGIVCDGAKSSCAAKIATSLEAAILGFYMASENKVFSGGDGIVKNDIEDTIRGVARIGKDGMTQTDLEILDIMLNK